MKYCNTNISFIFKHALFETASFRKSKFLPRSRGKNCVITQDFYMNDILTDADTIENILEFKFNITNILNKAKFELRKFNSNFIDVL